MTRLRAPRVRAGRPEATAPSRSWDGSRTPRHRSSIVTLVIAAMSFYLIALVVWMALHYRTPAAVPPDLVRDVQDLLDQNEV